MDIVLTYVDGLDPVWQQEYSRAINRPVNIKRFRDWGTLRHLFRAFEVNMPFVENIYLVVSGPSQVPSWINQDNVKVVLHSDIIPQDKLPVFNSASIEMYLHRIPGLSEEFVYFNDDIFPIMLCTPEDFFVDGKAALYHVDCLLALDLYKKHTRNSDRLARRAAGLKKSIIFKRPQHSCASMLKSSSEELYSIMKDEIDGAVSMIRQPYNYNQYIYTDYLLFKGRSVRKKLSKKHFSLSVAKLDEIRSFLLSPDRKIVCINDVNMSEEKFVAFRDGLLETFQEKFPQKSRYEL